MFIGDDYIIAIFVENGEIIDTLKITRSRVGFGDFTAMVTFTKKYLQCQINWVSVYKGFVFVK